MNNNKSLNILVIDDNPSFVMSFENLVLEVTSKNINLLQHAFSAIDGLKMMREYDYDFVFMDIDMPETDGIMATRFATYDFDKPGMTIIAISFHSETFYRNKMIQAGARCYLCKDEIQAESLLRIFETENLTLKQSIQ